MNPLQVRSWSGVRRIFRIRSLMVALVLIALVLAVIAQSRRAAQRERQLRVELYQARAVSKSERAMRDFLGDLGVVILKAPTKVELLRVQTIKESPGYLVTPTGQLLDREFTDRLTRVLLRQEIYFTLGVSDLPDPEVGLRIWRGQDSVDLLFSLTGSSPASTHLDVWSFVKPEHGESSLAIKHHEKCFYDANFEKLVAEIKSF